MNVKPEIFQATKQTILKNKRQFIEIQLGEVAKRILALKNENSSLKSQIKQLKTKSNDATTSALTTRENHDQNKENKSLNLLKLKNRGIESEALTHRNSDKQYKDDYEKQAQQIKQLELTLSNEQKQRQKQLAYLQDYINMLKKAWEKKQSKDIVLQQNVMKPGIQVKISNDEFQTAKMAGKSIPLKKTIRFIQSKPERMMISTQSLNESQIDGSQNSQILFTNSSLNNSNFLNQKQQAGFSNSFLNSGEYFKISQQPKRKTMSLSLNNSKSNQMMGFKFGKKSSNRNKDEESYENEYIKDSYNKNNHIYQKQMRPSSVSISFPRDPTNPISHENSVLNHSNSRTSMSVISNTGSNKSTMRRTQASKSYAKIVTKLTCQGCSQEYRPNQYYTHIEDCRQYMKLKLLEEKERIQDEINQTLNLSISHF